MMSKSSSNVRHCGGFSLVEVVIVMTILSALVALVSGLVISSSEASEYSDSMNRANEVNQDILNDVANELVSSVGVLQNDTLGNAYFGMLDLSAAAPSLASTRLPVIDVDGVIEKEAATGAKSGNALFFARHAWTTEFACASSNTYRIDVYRFVGYYLAKAGDGPHSGSSLGLNLCKYVSEPLADADQIDAITDATDQAEILRHLRTGSVDIFGREHDEASLVLNRGDDPTLSGTIRQITSSGVLSSTPTEGRASPWVIERDLGRSSDGMLFFRHFSVATNFSPAGLGVARFSAPDSSGDGFPHGFEVQLVGPSSIREVMLHSTVVSTRRGQLPAYSDLRRIVFLQDI